ncbi:hypothetical protein, conserved [Leishmania lindenbergi]|uniref:Uncharacterized protein n=1 Tax=Leishmania lindenbergi TaxID=651832 RepID=A0AAW3ATK7_9TRYP
MASPQYSTPYSVLSYPTYTPLSVAPLKGDESPVGDDVSLVHAAVTADVAHQHINPTPALQQLYTPSTAANNGTRCPAPVVGTASQVQSGKLFSAAPHLTRVNAPLYAPSGAVKVEPVLYGGAPPPVSAAQPYYNDISGIQDRSTVPLTRQAPSRSHAPALVVDGIEVEVQSDVVSISQAAPNLCAFQKECYSLLSMLNASSLPRRMAPSPSTAVNPPHPPLSVVTDAEATCAVTGAVRRERQPVIIPLAHASASTLSSAKVSSPSPSLAGERVEMKASTEDPAHSATYVQLMQEMDDLASLLEGEGELPGQRCAASRQHSVSGTTPAKGARGDYVASMTPVPSARPANSPTDTPEKQCQPAPDTHQCDRSRPPSLPLLSPSRGELVNAPTRPFWSTQLLKWIAYLVEQRQSALQRIQAFEDARAPSRRGACASAVADESATTLSPSPIRVTEEVLRLLRSLDPATGDVDTWTAIQQRHTCTRMANLLAEMTATEEKAMADVLNDAAAGATLELESTVKKLPTTIEATSSPASAVSEAYRQDMMVTLSLLEQISQENKALKLRVEEVETQATKVREEMEREKAAKEELGKYFDRLAADNSRLTAELSEMEAKLRKTEEVAKSVSQEEVLRNQLDRQTLHLRDVRAELDDVKDDSDALRRTILQLRDALVRHRSVIDLLTRRRREREHAAAGVARRSGSRRALSPGIESPFTQLIEDVLSGACDPPSFSSSTAPPEKNHSSDNDAGGDSDGHTSLR